MAVSQSTLQRMAADMGIKPATVTQAAPVAPTVHKVDIDLSNGYSKTITYSEAFGHKPPSGNDWILPDFSDVQWDDSVKHYVPVKDEQYVPRADVLEEFIVSIYGAGNRSGFLHGDKGTGKSSLPEYICACLSMPFIRVNMTADSEGSKLLGNVTIENGGMGWQTGAAELACLANDLGCWLQIDEIDAAPAGINMNLQWLLERGGKLYIDSKVCDDENERLVVPKNFFRIIATSNTQLQGDTTGNFVGTEPQNTALLDRFDFAMEIEFPESRVEKEVIKSRTGAPDDTINEIMAIAEATRRAAQQNKLMFSMSPRATQQVARQFMLFGDLRRAFMTGYGGKLIPTDKAELNEMLRARGI